MARLFYRSIERRGEAGAWCYQLFVTCSRRRIMSDAEERPIRRAG